MSVVCFDRTVLRERIQSGQALLNDLSQNSIKKVKGTEHNKLNTSFREGIKITTSF